MKIYTRRGDEGDTSLLGGVRVAKSAARVEAYGTVDELNAAIGLALALDTGVGPPDAAGLGPDAVRLERVQDDLFALGARLAAADLRKAEDRGVVPAFPAGRVEDLEKWIDELDESLPELDAFVHPGGSPVGAQLHACRTVCRRAERAAVRLVEEGGRTGPSSNLFEEGLVDVVLPYLNRLSDLLFTLARAVNLRADRPELEWVPVRRQEAAPHDGGRDDDRGRGDEGRGDDDPQPTPEDA